MLEGLYSAAAGMAAQQQRIDGVANDLANASTTGYKHVRVGFRDLLYSAQGGAAGPTVLAGAGAAAGFIGRSQEQGALQTTGQPLDVAIQGPGFFQVTRPDGSTRAHARRLAATRRDRPPDDEGRHTSSSRRSRVPRGTTPDQLSIAADGTVRVGSGQSARPHRARDRARARRPAAARRKPLRRQRAERRRRPPPATTRRCARACSRARTSTSATRWST